MAVKDIIKYPNTILSSVATPIQAVTQDLKTLVYDMVDTMEFNKGIGLAAPQIGVQRCAIVVLMSPHAPVAMINPVIFKKLDGVVWSMEGCLSLPGVTKKIKRAKTVSVGFLDIAGDHHRVTFTGTVALIVQHEIDHLNGICIANH